MVIANGFLVTDQKFGEWFLPLTEGKEPFFVSFNWGFYTKNSFVMTIS